MWNNYTDRNPSVVGDCSWEARAFAEDKGSATWPPRSYTCNFCMREFRSAQALGGHMNVHRRDRARLRQSAQPGTEPISHAAASATQHPMVFSSSEFVASGGMIFYSNQAGPVFLSAATDSTYRTDANFPMASSLLDKVGMFRDHDHDNGNNIGTDSSADDTFVTELDLELRLGW